MASFHNSIFIGDALSVLKTLPDGIAQTCVTSPPYYGLRDYGVPGQIGLEESPELYIERLVEVFREVRRVLRDDGTLWLNIGDSHANDEKWGGSTGGKHVEELHGDNAMRRRRYTGLKPKDLMMIPARVALALQADGWWLRSDIIWYKLTAMPESVLDRPSTAHEHIFLLAKSADYFYDADAVRQPLRPKTFTTFGIPHHPQGNDALGKVKSDNWGSTVVERQPKLTADGEIAGANLRNVWPLASQPYSGAHFATFPPKLIEPCILAGSSSRACEQCGAPWERVTERGEPVQQHWAPGTQGKIHVAQGKHGSTSVMNTGYVRPPITIGWQPTCACTNEGTGHCVILDCFMGAGTTALVAIKHHRDYLGVEINPEYVALSEKRIATVQQTLWESEAAV